MRVVFSLFCVFFLGSWAMAAKNDSTGGGNPPAWDKIFVISDLTSDQAIRPDFVLWGDQYRNLFQFVPFSAPKLKSEIYSKNQIINLSNSIDTSVDDSLPIVAGVPVFSDSVLKSRVTKLYSPVEMVYNEDVRFFIDLYTIRKRAILSRMLGDAQYYFPMFQSIMDSYNLPPELCYLPVVESAINPKAMSRAGAAGIWQFIKGTGVLFHLKINSLIDERMDPVKSTHAAAQFLGRLYDEFKSWELALAAYNCGPGNVRKAIEKVGKNAGFWQIYPLLPRETRTYVPAFIAAVYLMNNYQYHNITPELNPHLADADTVIVTRKTDLKLLASQLDIPVEQIIALNPQYKKALVPADLNGLPVMLPVESLARYIIERESIDKSTADGRKKISSTMPKFNPNQIREQKQYAVGGL